MSSFGQKEINSLLMSGKNSHRFIYISVDSSIKLLKASKLIHYDKNLKQNGFLSLTYLHPQ